MMPTELTYQQKLDSFAFKYYQDYQWKPKKGDYYTSTRADLQLYQIVDEDEGNFYTEYCHQPEAGRASWVKERFLLDFGVRRLFVPDFVMGIERGQQL